MSAVLVAIMVVPLLAAAISWWAGPRLTGAATVTSGSATLGLTLALVPAVARGRSLGRAGTAVSGRAVIYGQHAVTALSSWLRVDSLSLVFLLATAFLYTLTAIFAVGYVFADHDAGSVYRRRLFAGMNIFAWAMAMAPLVNNLGLLWVAIEVTTVVSALLVALEGTDSAVEAAWKYILLASLGLGLSLLATVVMYHAGSYSLGQVYDLSYTKLVSAAARFPAGTVRLAYLLAVLGFGTKVGFFPVHTWLPDAHSEAPTPVSALLSGALLATCFYAILRYYQITERAAGAPFPRCAGRLRGRHPLVGRAVPGVPARPQADACLLVGRAHGDPRRRHELRISFGRSGRALARPRPRGSQRHRLFRRRERGPKNADEGPRANPGRYRPAPVERSFARRGHVGPLRPTPVRHVPL